MTSPKETFDTDLPGLDGSNPLGFLASLGVLAELSASQSSGVWMSWHVLNGGWRPRLHTCERLAPDAIAKRLAEQLRLGRATVSSEGESEKSLAVADKAHMSAKKRLKDKLDEIKKRKLRGKERDQAIEFETRDLVASRNQKRDEWLRLLKQSSPSPELALGKDPAALQDHFRLTAQEVVADVTPANRACADLMASFGCDAIVDTKTNKVRTTSFCFVTGSGWQYFLQNVRELLGRVDSLRIFQALFEPRPHADEKLSMRWDPIEDRRYAMMWSDPTSSGNEAKTNWALNLLAYRGLQLLPCVPTSRGVKTTGFSNHNRSPDWSWPIWSACLSADTIRSLLALHELQQTEPDRTAADRAPGPRTGSPATASA